MKSCPTCKRTFEDTTVFCLVDGSILSAPFDPHAPVPPSEPPPTEVMKAPRSTHSAQTTITSPTPLVAPQSNPTFPSQPNAPVSNAKKFLLIGVGAALFGVIITAGVLLIFLGSSPSCPEIRVNCYPGSSSTICAVQVNDPSMTSNQGGEASTLLCSLSTALAFQAPSLPKAVTDISWTVSNGKLKTTPDHEYRAEIDTTGLAGRQISVTAKVSGYSWRCTNTASSSFVAE